MTCAIDPLVTKHKGHPVCADCGVLISRGSQVCKLCFKKRGPTNRQPPLSARQCQGCGTTIIRSMRRTAKDARKYCSRQCAFSHHRQWFVVWNKGKGKRHPRTSSPIYIKRCDCGIAFVGRTRLQRWCRSCRADPGMLSRRIHRLKKNRNMMPRKCRECDRGFTPHAFNADGRRIFCSKRCSMRNGRRAGRCRRLRRGVPRERFDPREIFRRDGWRCGQCGSRVNQRLKYPHPNSASLDHIIPLSAGGGHERRNVQLAHLYCNLEKRDLPIGQLRLIG